MDINYIHFFNENFQTLSKIEDNADNFFLKLSKGDNDNNINLIMKLIIMFIQNVKIVLPPHKINGKLKEYDSQTINAELRKYYKNIIKLLINANEKRQLNLALPKENTNLFITLQECACNIWYKRGYLYCDAMHDYLNNYKYIEKFINLKPKKINNQNSLLMNLSIHYNKKNNTKYFNELNSKLKRLFEKFNKDMNECYDQACNHWLPTLFELTVVDATSNNSNFSNVRLHPKIPDGKTDIVLEYDDDEWFIELHNEDRNLCYDFRSNVYSVDEWERRLSGKTQISKLKEHGLNSVYLLRTSDPDLEHNFDHLLIEKMPKDSELIVVSSNYKTSFCRTLRNSVPVTQSEFSKKLSASLTES